MKIGRYTRILSFVLVLALLVNMLPVSALATGNEDTSAEPVEINASSEVQVIGEVEGLREEEVKHFRLSDGSFVAVSYGLPVHFQSDDGQWQDIDNSLSLAAGAYRTANPSAPAAFSSTLSDGKLFTVERDGQSVSMSLLDTSEAERMISGDMAVDETEPLETEPTEVTEETVPQETEPETEPVTEPVEETQASDEQVEETVAETEATTLEEATEPEATVSEAVEETASEDVQANPDAAALSEDAEETTEIVVADVQEESPAELSGEVSAVSMNETISQEPQSEVTETESAETDPIETLPLETTPIETVPETTEPTATETEPTEPAETAPQETVPEETVSDETVPEETIPDETVPEETEEVSAGDGMLTFDRDVIAEVVDDAPAMLNLQEKYSWDVNDVIPEKIQSSLLYRDVFPGIDLQYTTFGYNIKEQIVVNEPQESYRFDFLLESTGLHAVLNENGSISFLDDSENEAYQIPIPCMEDADGLTSHAVHFILNETEQGTVLTVEADKDWINSEDRTYPVKIDPTLVVISGKALEDIYSAYTMEAAPNDTTLGRQWLYVGAQPYSTTNDGRYRTYMHFQSMPTIPNGSEVVDAQLSLYKTAYTERNCEQLPIGVYEVTTSLPSSYSSYYDWFSKMTWRRDQPEYDTTNAIDYAFCKTGKEYVTWHLTELVKKWYVEGTDNTTVALAMTNEDEIDTYYYFASATFYAYAGSIPPILTVSYRNNTGIEPYYTYATLGAGNAGTAYISDHTGQLKIAKELVSYASSTNPFSLSLIYNSDYFASSSANYCPPSKLGLSMNVGAGWTLDCIQKVEPETISNISYLKYTDGDGTIHYFCKDSSKSSTYYYDEDGLGLKIKSDGSNAYTMSDDKGNEWIFTGNYLTTLKDSDGNKININYSSGRITSISQVNNGQSAIEVAKFTYSGNDLISLTDAAGNVYTLTYSGGNLVGIKKSSATIAAYAYSGYRVNKMTDSESNYSIAFSYSNGKISQYQEVSSAGAGATVSVTYPDYSETIYRDHGADRSSGTGDDVLTHYLFDYAGRTVNAYTTDKTGNVLGATNAVYSGSGSTDKTNNRTMRTGSIGVARQQLLRNGGLESAGNEWTFSGTSRATTKPRSGAYSIKGTLSSNGTQNALISSGMLTAGKTYTVSGYVNTSDVTKFEGGGIAITVTDGTNGWTSQWVNYITSTAVDNGWVRISTTFTPSVTDEYGIIVYNSGAIGTFYADDFQLEEGDAPSSYNLLENGNMERSDSGWTMGTNARYSSSRGAAGSSNSLKVTGDPQSASTNAYQDVVLNLPGTQTYVLSGWAQANAVPDDPSELDNPNDMTKKCGLRATITYSDGTTEGHYVAFNSDISRQWQFTSTSIVPKQPSKTVNKIRVTLAFEGNANFCYFDDIALLREVAQTMKYDADGNLVSVTSTGLDKDENTYSGGNLIKTITGGNGTFTYTYDTTYTHRLKSVSNGQITQSMGYDSTGNVTTTTLAGSSGKKLQTTATYGGNGNRISSVTDASGAQVSYAYGSGDSVMLGLPTSVTDPNGTVTTSAYDSFGRVTQTGIANTADLLYTYANGNLGSIQRTDGSGAKQTYGFTYDSFGNMLSAKVGNRSLSTNTYANGNGQLTKQTYGNGASVSFTYDILGRVKTASYADGRKVTYAYNGEGLLHSLTETGGEQDVTYVYTYDSVGRLIDSQQLEGINSVLRTNQNYNSSNQMTKQGWQMGGDSYAENYTYNSADGSLNTFSVARNGTELAKFTMAYDTLRRLTSSSSDVYTKSFAYRDISDSQTTTQVSSVDYYRTSYGNTYKFKGYSYTYDDMGNILTSKDSMNNTTTYTYDKQGQLLTEKGSVSGFGEPFSYSNTYTYDTVGNILTSSDGTKTHTYTYGDSEWKDLLTAYDGESITYDAIGNPTSYYNGDRWTMGWTNGRQLTSLSKKPPVVITTQPENYFGSVGGNATFTVAAEGDRLTYQWQRSTDDGTTWSNVSGGTSTTLSVPIQASVNGNLYRCIAKDFMGHIATSQAGKLSVTSSASTLSEFDPEFTVINEPDDYYGRIGDTATFIVEAEGANLSYQWLYRAPGANNFEYCTSSDATSNTIRVEMTAANNGGEFRCFITDANGDMGSTRIATIKLDILDWNMEYNTSGIRTKRVSDELTYNYIYAGDKLMRMTVGNDILDFSYDTNGAPLTMTYNGTVYYYITNLQGDVVSLEKANGSSGAIYAYDAWGNIISMTGDLAELNPLRYRGYVYDQETGFYYLNSRYYDPAVGRFINADSYASTGLGFLGYNMYAYCINNPVSQIDPDGEIAISTLILIGAGIVGAAFAGYTAYKEYKAGYDTVHIIGDSICNGLAGFSIMYTGGMSLYQCYQNYCYLNAITPVTSIGTQANVTSQLQSCANIANSKISGSGAVVGTKKHTAFAHEVNALGNQSLATEVSYKNGEIVPYGTSGSIRFDVLQYSPNGTPIAAWDFKTGSAVLSAARIDQMQTKSGLCIPIYVIK